MHYLAGVSGLELWAQHAVPLPRPVIHDVSGGAILWAQHAVPLLACR